MKCMMNYLVVLIIIIVPAEIFGEARVEISDVPKIGADRTNWCWAAVSECVLNIQDITMEQCSIQTWVNIEKESGCYDGETGEYFNCCESTFPCCNTKNILSSDSEEGCVDDLLAFNGLLSTYYNQILEYEDVRSAISGGNPFMMALSADDHFVLGWAYEEDEDEFNIEAMDPGADPPQTYTKSYSKWQLKHGWCETLVVNGSFDIGSIDDPVARLEYFYPIMKEEGVCIQWQTKWELGTANFIIQKYNRDKDRYWPVGLVKAKGDEDAGAYYEYVDNAGRSDDIYRLLEMEGSGRCLVLKSRWVMESKPEVSEVVARRGIDIEAIRRETKGIIEKHRGAPAFLQSPVIENYDWVAIYPDSFENDVSDLITWRWMQGYSPGGVSIEEVDSLYGGIKEYVQYLWDNQNGSLEYVFVVGKPCDSTCLEHNLIPIERYGDGPISSDGTTNYESDVELGDIDGDGLAEIAVGRLPAGEVVEVASYVNKVINYEEAPGGDWVEEVTYFINADDGNGCSGSLIDSLSQLLTGYIPQGYDLHHEYVNDSLYQEGLTYEIRQARAINEFNSGRSLMFGFGVLGTSHNFVGWFNNATLEDHFRIDSLDTNGIFPFILGASCEICDIAEHIWPARELVRELLFDSERGAIAAFGPTGGTWQMGN